jgi:hypothetical protein
MLVIGAAAEVYCEKGRSKNDSSESACRTNMMSSLRAYLTLRLSRRNNVLDASL